MTLYQGRQATGTEKMENNQYFTKDAVNYPDGTLGSVRAEQRTMAVVQQGRMLTGRRRTSPGESCHLNFDGETSSKDGEATREEGVQA